jgi:hypothetical protein
MFMLTFTTLTRERNTGQLQVVGSQRKAKQQEMEKGQHILFPVLVSYKTE